MPAKAKLLACTLAATTLPSTGQTTMSQPGCDFAKVAEDYIVRRFPSFDPTGKRLVMSDMGDSWEVTYRLPEYMLGGAPVVSIDKQTCAVVRVTRTQ
jgi:hypothetical protein